MQTIKDYMSTKERLNNFTPPKVDKTKVNIPAKIILSHIEQVTSEVIAYGR